MSDRQGNSLPLTAAQAGIWFAQQLDPENAVFQLGEYLDIGGPVDTALLEEALRRVVGEADTLRVRFDPTGGEPVQRVVPTPDFAWAPTWVDVSDEPDPEAAAQAWMAGELARPLDPEHDPLFLFALFKIAEDRYFWYYRYHHLVADGYTVVLIAQRVPEIYSALAAGLPVGANPFAPLGDLIAEHTAYGTSDQRAADREYWLERMAGAPQPVSLSGRQPGAVLSLIRRTAHLQPQDTDALRNLGRAAEVSWPPALIASVAAYLHRLTGEEEIVLGFPVSNRLGRTARNAPAMVSNVLPLRVSFRPGTTVAELMGQVSRELREVMRHQRYPYEDLRQDLGMLADDRRLVGPHVNLMLFDHKLSFGDHLSRPRTLATGPTDDLSFLIYDRTTAAGLQIDCDANPDLYSPAELAAYQDGFLEFLRELAVAGPDRTVETLAVAEEARLVRTRAVTAVTAVSDQPAPQAIAEPGTSAGAASDTPRGPRTPQEEILCGLVAEVLDVDRVGIDDNIFLLGGRSLQITRLVSRIRSLFTIELPLRSVFENPTVAALAEQLAHAKGARQPLAAVERPAVIPLSPAQNRLWFLNQLSRQGSVYNEAVAIRLHGRLDVPALHEALNDVVARHESLRTVFPEAGGEPRQVILDPAEAIVDLPVRPTTSDELPAALAENAVQGFDLGTQTPVRAQLLALAEDEHVLQLVVHHIACDGWSVAPFTRDLSVAYADRTVGTSPLWAPLPVQYADYVLWQRDVLGDENDPDSELTRQLRYWREALDGLPEEIALPNDRQRPAVATYRGGRVTFRIPADVHEKLRALATGSRASMFMLAQAGVAALLTRHGAGEDIPIGSPIAGRTDVLLDDLVGFFVNTLVLRTDTSGDPTFRELLDRVRETDLAAYAHQDLAFERLVEAINPTRSLARHPLFQIAVDVQDNAASRLELVGLTADAELLDTGSARFDLLFQLEEQHTQDGDPAGISGRLEFARDLFDEVSARRLAEGFVRLLEAVAADPGVSLGAVDVLSPEERARVVSEWNDTSREVTAGSLVSVFEAQVARTPDAPAVVFEGEVLSYAQFNARVNQLAHELVARGVTPGDFVAVVVPRSLELVTALYAVVKAGAAYVPVDPDYPVERINSILQDATPTMVLTTRSVSAALPDAGVPVLLLDGPGVGSGRPDANLDVVLPVNAAAYVIFTSGSTGRPKGVVIGHDAINNRLAWMQNTYPLDATDRVLQKTPSGFDVSVWEFFWPLQTGATLVLARPEGHKDPAYLARVIQDQNITTTHFVPSMLQAFLTEPSTARITTLRRVICSGEALPPEAVHRFHHLFDGVELHNLYGPTEAAVDVTAHTTTSDAVTVPIGRPIWNTQTYILDSALRPVPVGVPGELYLAGTQLAHGYTHQPTLTAERFTANPYSTTPGARMYRTGDLARWTLNGELEYHGRTDDQIKLRGLRIELGDIETTLTTHPTITHTTVQLREDQPGNPQLIAYLVPAPGQTVDTTAVREHAAALLPDYMVPAAFITLDALPLTANGKLDRKALPAPDFTTHTTTRTPRNPREELLTTLFADILGLDTLGIDDNFFTLGGHSLLATRLISRIRTTFDTELDVSTVFEAPSVAALALRLTGAKSARRPLTAMERPEHILLSPAQQRLWFINRLQASGGNYNTGVSLRLSGEVDPEALRSALGDVVARHESLRTVFPDIDGQPRQLILSPGQAVPELTVTNIDAGDLDAALSRAASSDYDLAVEPPLRSWLFVLGPSEYVLLLVKHHIASDGWSMGPLSRDLSVAYAARLTGAGPDWEPLPVQYADYTLWQREVLGEESDPDSVVARQLAYWRSALADLPEELALPTDRPRPAKLSYHGETVPVRFSPELHRALVALAGATGSTVFMVMQAAIAALLGKLGAGDDIPIGSAVAGRTDQALDDLIGFFVNTLVLRTDLSGNPTFRELVERVKETDLAAYANQDVPFERLVDDLNPVRSLARHPLFQVMMSMQNTPDVPMDLAGVSASPLPVGLDTAKFDLSFQLGERFGPDGAPSGVEGGIEFATDLFDRASAEALAGRLERLLTVVTAEPELPLAEVDVLAPGERERILTEWNPVAYEAAAATLPELFEAQAARTPEAVAVVFGEHTVSYAELNARANRLARHLIAQGAGPGRLVALALPRSEQVVVALLAVVKAGAGYLPVDPDYPAERIAHMFTDARPGLLLTTTENAPALAPLLTENQPLVLLDESGIEGGLSFLADDDVADIERGGPVLPASCAYVMYTSGSTGKPKGVVITHGDVVALAADSRFAAGHDRVLVHSPQAFDASTYEVWTPLLAGGRAVLAPVGDLTAAVLRETIGRHGVTAAFFTAALFHLFAEDDPGCLNGMREVWTGGDVVRADALRRVAEACPGLVVVDVYGPTETTTFATAFRVGSVAEVPQSVPIGRPLDSMRVHLLDSALRPVPPGVPGDLYIAGTGLARGYLGRPGPTAERFLADPFGGPGERMYRAGDLARWTADGQIQFLGRTDGQVKLRGFRIELGEIESALAGHPRVAQAGVIVREHQQGMKRLVAYVVPAGGSVDPDELRAHVAALLPEYMVPSAFVALDALPLTANGKLDRKALPEPDFSVQVGDRGPRDAREELLCALFAELLGLERVGIDDSFFGLGGDSIVSIQLVSRAHRAGLLLRTSDVFQHQTPAALAAVAEDVGSVAEESPEAGIGPVPLTPIMRWLRELGGPVDGFHQAMLIQAPAGCSAEALSGALQGLLDRHDVLRARLDRPAGGDWALETLPRGSVRANDVFRRVDAPTADVTEEAHAAQCRLDPEGGVMLQAVWFDAGPDVPGRILLMVHHLVVDGISWRILIPELPELYRAATEGRDAELGSVGTSYRRWSERLAEAAQEPRRLAELPLWTDMLGAPEVPLGARPLDPVRDNAAAARKLTLTLPAEYTEPLLTRVPAIYHAGINDVLLTAFALAVIDWRRDRGASPDVLLDLEGHGREEIMAGVDVSRTVGWFTSMYPVRLDPQIADAEWPEVRSGGPALGRALKEVKEQLHAIPDRGIGYGLLRHLHQEAGATLAALPAPQISFNYLGRIDMSDGAHDGGVADWAVRSDADLGDGHDPAMPFGHALELNAVTQDQADGPRLTATWSWPHELFTEDRVRSLAEGWFAALRALVAHAEAPEAGGFTPSDVPLVNLSQNDLDLLQEEWGF